MLALRRSIRTGSYRVDGRSADSLTLTDAASNCGGPARAWAEPPAGDNASAASANQTETGGTGAAYWRFMSSSNEDDTNARFSGGESWAGSHCALSTLNPHTANKHGQPREEVEA